MNRILLLVSFLAAALCVQAQSEESLIRKGNRSYRKEKFEKAEECYRKALELKPVSVEAQFNLGDALYSKGEYDAASAAFQKVLELTGDKEIKSNAVYNMGNCLLAQDMFYDAFNIYKVSLKLNSDNADALYNLEYCRANLLKSNVYIASNIEHGTVQASEEQAFNGQKVNLSSQPEQGYALSQYFVVPADTTQGEVKVNGATFVMPKCDAYVTAVFKQLHNITVEKNIPHGLVKADRSQAVEGQSVTLSSQPESGYLAERYKVYRTGKPSDTIQVNDTVFQMPDYDVTVTAVFSKGLRIVIDSTVNGKIESSDTIAMPNQNIALIVTPDDGYELDDIVVQHNNDPNQQTPVTDDNLFSMPHSSVTVKATFREATEKYAITIDTLSEGGRAVADADSATRRSTVKLGNIPLPGYKFKEYVITQTSDTSIKVQPLGNFFTMPSYDVTVSAVFEKDDQNGQDNQQQQNEDQQDQQQNQDQQQSQGQDQQQSQDQQQQQQNSRDMSENEAERMLQALENQEKQTIEKVNEEKVRTQPKRKTDKDW